MMRHVFHIFLELGLKMALIPEGNWKLLQERDNYVVLILNGENLF
jgi:hypothetical protein